MDVALAHRAVFRSVFRFVRVVLRLLLFLLMYWLRGPIVFLCRMVSAPLLLLWLFSLYAFPGKAHMAWGFAAISFASFVMMWTYDYILTTLSPEEPDAR